MLKEHLRFIISIDTLGREILTAPGGSADVSLTVGHGSDGLKELLAKVYKNMHFEYQHHHYCCHPHHPLHHDKGVQEHALGRL